MFLFCSLSLSFSLIKRTGNEFSNGQNVTVFANSLRSTKRPIPLDFKISDLFCSAMDEKSAKKSVNDEITGNSLVETPISFQIGKETECETICTKFYNKAKRRKLIKLIDRGYKFYYQIDGLPVSYHVYDGNKSSIYVPGFDIGYVDERGKHYLNNYVEFIVEIEHFQNEKTKIVGFEAYSIVSKAELDCDPKTSIPVEDLENVTFQYSIRYETAKTTWEQRWQKYSTSSQGNSKIHLFSIVNTILIVLVQSVVVGAILLRTIKIDFLRYSKMLEDDEDPLEETGWKLIHGDVFRRPARVQFLTSFVGCGLHLFISVAFVIFFSAIGLIQTQGGGFMVTFALLAFIGSSVAGGLSSSVLFHTIGTKKWRNNMILTAIGFVGPAAAVYLIMQIIFKSAASTASLSFKGFFNVLLMIGGISIAFNIVGSFIGLVIKPIEFPSRVNQLPRQIPTQPQYLKPYITMTIGGTIIFLSFGIQMRMILRAIWTNTSYYSSYILLFVAFASMALISCEISVLFVYLHLTHEDYNWWWPAFNIPAASGISFFLFSLFYLFFDYAPVDSSSYIIYILVSLIISYGIALMNGAIGFSTSFVFVIKIFSELKIE